jgi:hypothetical protein
MIASFNDIQEIILKNPNKDLIHKGREYNKRLRMHMYGIDLATHLPKIDGFERESVHKVRGKYAKSNKDLFSRVTRPIDKVFSAKGGSVYYRMPSQRESMAKAYQMDVSDGMSLKAWMNSVWRAHYLDDPYGVVLLEVASMPMAIKLRNEGKPFVYPTYKPITDIYDYGTSGVNLEYLVLNTTVNERIAAGFKAEDKIYRFIDDSKDYWVKVVSESQVSILEEHTYQNYFGYVPGMINSDIIDPKQNGGFLSLLEEALELADIYLLKGSIRITHDFFHGFPKYWEYADHCQTCTPPGGGLPTGYVDGKVCPSCKGTGKKIMMNVGDVKLLEYPDKDNPAVPTVAGYVAPSKDYHEMSNADISALEDAINFTLWGTGSKMRTQGMSTGKQGDAVTATEIMDDMQPKADRLYAISDSAEKRCKFIMDGIIRVCMAAPAYPGCSFSLGRRYIIENADQIWEKYSKARIAGAAQSVLDDLLIEYYEAKYQSDPVKLEIQLKLMKVEPFVHHKIAEVMTLNPAKSDYAAKLYFGEWLSMQNEGFLLVSPIEALRTDLAAYATSKAAVIESDERKAMEAQAKMKPQQPNFN